MFYYLKLYWHLQVANLRSKSIYPFNFIIGILSVILLGIANIMFSWIITERVPRIEGYGFYEMVFIFSLWLVPHSIFVMFFRQIWEIDNIIKNGEFDRYFLRPLSTLFQFFTSRFEIAGIGDFIAGLIGFFICFNHITDWNSLKLINLFIVVVSGLVIEWSIYTIIGCTINVNLN
ncbi:ABC-2 family transporter protein, partial [Bacillus sp. AFS055030]|uniref:ABC-2 family transporter protein n=1 Tax=Bacillus sp. AFS055030 TaxID=2033507 RepID=UPI000C030E1F